MNVNASNLTRMLPSNLPNASDIAFTGDDSTFFPTHVLSSLSEAPPAAPSAPIVVHMLSSQLTESTAIAVAVILMVSILILVSVTAVLVFLIKRLTAVLTLMRSETSSEVRAGLLNEPEPAPDAFGGTSQNSDSRVIAAVRGNLNSKLTRSSRREKPKRSNKDIENNTCGLDEIDEEDDHRL